MYCYDEVTAGYSDVEDTFDYRRVKMTVDEYAATQFKESIEKDTPEEKK